MYQTLVGIGMISAGSVISGERIARVTAALPRRKLGMALPRGLPPIDSILRWDFRKNPLSYRYRRFWVVAGQRQAPFPSIGAPIKTPLEK